jgi:hypothetical protein
MEVTKMNIRNLSGNDLADLAANVLTLLGGTELSAIDSHVRADLVTAFGTLPADLAADTAAAAVLDSEKQAAFSSRDTKIAQAITLLNRVRDALKSGLAPKKQYNLCGFDFPGVRSAVYIAQDPTNMAASGFSNGVNKGQFDGNNKSGLVTYEVWRREGDTGAWHQHLLTKKQTFKDTGVTPGQFYEYRVRAVAAQTISEFSNSAVVYGVL